MTDRQQLHKKLDGTKTRDLFKELYGTENIDIQINRYKKLLVEYYKHFADDGADLQFFSTSGRTEVGGNHTDHNQGRVIAAAVNFDTIGVATKTNDNTITLYSQGYEDVFRVKLDSLEPKAEEEETTTALIRGTAARFNELGYKFGGFNAYISSHVLGGSGLSSSASIEVLLGTILSSLYNKGGVGPEELAMVGQYAENIYFNKPCGLMDQMACAVGGFVSIDFGDKSNPVVKKIDFDLKKEGYSLLVVDTGGSHADLTKDYADIPQEMKEVASKFDKSVLRQVGEDKLIQNISVLRPCVGDRAILRSLHFFSEDKRAQAQFNALQEGRFDDFLALVTESGNSSWKYLQNVYTNQKPMEQGVTLALALTERYIKEKGFGACRVHGGGFAGTIQAFIKEEHVSEYIDYIEEIFGDNSATALAIRSHGTLHLNPLLG
ncbi:MAG TPA: galactokinase family protein [Bacillota bacterium]|nr:galactokinase family protein [Bacillota bacterium]